MVKINVQQTDVSILKINNEDFISLTDATDSTQNQLK